MDTRLVVQCAMGDLPVETLSATTGRSRNACYQQVMRIRRKIKEFEEGNARKNKPYHIPVCYEAALQYVMRSRYDEDKYSAMSDALEIQERHERETARLIYKHFKEAAVK